MSYQLIPIKDLKIDSSNVRKEVGDIGELENSIESVGVLEPLIVREKDGQYHVVVGQRRLAAANSVGLKEVPTIIRELTDEEAFIASASENIHRENLNPRELAELYVRAKDIFGNQRAVAEAFDVSVSEVQQRLEGARLIGIIDKVKDQHAGVEIPRDYTKIDRISRTAKAVFPDMPEKQVELFDELKDKPRRDVQRATTYVKAKKEMEPETFDEKPVKEIVEDAFKVVNVDVKVRFDSNISKAIIKVAEDRGISWEDVVEIAVEQWLRQGGHLG